MFPPYLQKGKPWMFIHVFFFILFKLLGKKLGEKLFWEPGSYNDSSVAKCWTLIFILKVFCLVIIFFLGKWRKSAAVAFLERICMEPLDTQAVLSVWQTCPKADLRMNVTNFFLSVFRKFLKLFQYLLQKENPWY